MSSRQVKIRLHTENQLPRLPGSALKVPVWGGGLGSYPLLSLAPTHVEVELGCDNSIGNPMRYLLNKNITILIKELNVKTRCFLQ